MQEKRETKNMKKYVCHCKYESYNVPQFAAYVKSHKMNPVQCPKCKIIIKDKSGLKTHEKYCGIEKKATRFICPVCNMHIKTSHKKHLNACNGYGPRRRNLKPRGERGGWNRGKTYEEAYGKEKAKRLKEEIKIRSSLNHNWINFSEEKKNEIREQCSKNMLERYERGWEPICGRAPKLKYESHVAGNVSLDGTWELLTAIFFDNIGVQWIRNKKRFKYYNTIKGCISTYCPDFYVIDWSCYIEVKGYITDLDFIKWGQFPKKIEIWDKERLNELDILAGIT